MDDEKTLEEVQPEVKPEPKKRREPRVEVKALNLMAYRDSDRVLVVNVQDTTEAWLLERAMVPNNIEPFRVKESVLAAAPRPAMFDGLLEAVLPTAHDVRLALWKVGVVTIDDLQDTRKVRNALNRVAPTPAQLVKSQDMKE